MQATSAADLDGILDNVVPSAATHDGPVSVEDESGESDEEVTFVPTLASALSGNELSLAYIRTLPNGEQMCCSAMQIREFLLEHSISRRRQSSITDFFKSA